MVRKSVLRLGEIVRSTGVLSFYLYGISAIKVRVNMLQSNNTVLYKTRCTLYLNIIYIYISFILPPLIPSSTHPYVCADKKIHLFVQVNTKVQVILAVKNRHSTNIFVDWQHLRPINEREPLFLEKGLFFSPSFQIY